MEVLGAGEIAGREPRGLEAADPSDLGETLAGRDSPSMLAFRFRPQRGLDPRSLSGERHPLRRAVGAGGQCRGSALRRAARGRRKDARPCPVCRAEQPAGISRADTAGGRHAVVGGGGWPHASTRHRSLGRFAVTPSERTPRAATRQRSPSRSPTCSDRVSGRTEGARNSGCPPSISQSGALASPSTIRHVIALPPSPVRFASKPTWAPSRPLFAVSRRPLLRLPALPAQMRHRRHHRHLRNPVAWPISRGLSAATPRGSR